MYLSQSKSIYFSDHLCIYLILRVSIYLAFCDYSSLCLHQSGHFYIYLALFVSSNGQSMYFSLSQCLLLYVRLCVYPSFSFFIFLTIYVHTSVSVFLSYWQSMYLSRSLYLHLSGQLCMCLCL